MKSEITRRRGTSQESRMINNVRRCVQDKIANRKFEGYELEKETTRNCILETIISRISTTVLVVGPQGVGKTKMINTILDELGANQDIRGQYQVIKLDGYLHETDELAVQHIVRVLNCDLETEKELRGSAFDNLKYVIESLREADSSRKSLIMIFDNFHIFCDGEKNLLYNLLDMVNRKSAAICVIGVALNSSCLDALHVRTQSRLAITNVHLNHKTNVENRLKLIQHLFTMDKPSKQTERSWNKSVKQICLDNELRKLIGSVTEMDRSEGFFIQFLYHTLLYIDGGSTLTMDTFKNAFDDYFCDSLYLNHRLKNLTLLELGLMIAIHHTSSNFDTYLFNFEKIYECYDKVAQKSTGSLPQVDRVLAMKAFQNLKRRGYIKLKRDTEADSTSIEYNAYELLIRKDQIKESIRNLSYMPAELKQWMDNSLYTQ